MTYRGRPAGLLYCFVFAIAAFFARPAAAHHSAAATYDAGRTITLTGKVSEFAWRNPHCFLYLDVDAGPFKDRRYVVEMSSLVVLTSTGWTKSTVKAGDEIRIDVLPSRAGKPAGLCRNCEIRINGKVTKA
jgi:hypothetical protein